MLMTLGEYKSDIEMLNQAPLAGERAPNFRSFRYNSTGLTLNPIVKDQGMTEQPGDGDAQYCHTYKVFVGLFETGIPDEAYEPGAVWEMSRNNGGSFSKFYVLQPTVEKQLWREMILTPALIG